MIFALAAFQVMQILAGAGAGALVGFGISRARGCSAQACNVRARAAYSIVAGAFFGAAVAYYLVTT